MIGRGRDKVALLLYGPSSAKYTQSLFTACVWTFIFLCAQHAIYLLINIKIVSNNESVLCSSGNADSMAKDANKLIWSCIIGTLLGLGLHFVVHAFICDC